MNLLRVFALSLLLSGSLGGVPRLAAQQQQPQSPPPKQQPAPAAEKPKEDDDYEIIERQTPWGVMRQRVPKKKPSGAPGPAPAMQAVPNPVAQKPATDQKSAADQKPATDQTPAAGQKSPAAGPAGTPQQPASPASAAGAAPSVPPTPTIDTNKPASPQGDAKVSLNLENANLTQVINIIAGELKMNYIVDPAVKGVVNINTMGDLRQEDLLPLLQAILETNGATAVQSGSFWRIVPLKQVTHIPTGITQDPTGANIPADDRVVLDIVPLRFVNASDMAKILSGYLSDAGQITIHEPGNILLITETSRSMKRLLDLINVFDTDALAKQRVHVVQVQNSRAADMAKDLQSIFSAYALSDKSGAVRFLAIDRINTILVVSSNQGVQQEVEKWVEKLDQPTRKAGIQNFVYKVKNASAENLASVLTSLYTGTRSQKQQVTGVAPGLLSSGAGPAGPGGIIGAPGSLQMTPGTGTLPAAAETGPTEGTLSGGALQSQVKIVSDSVTNSLLIQATAQDYETIRQTLQDMDIVPRQVMIEARVYEVTLTGDLAFGVESFLQQRSGAERRLLGQFTTSAPGTTSTGSAAQTFTNAGLSLSAGTLVGHSRELLTFLNAQENRTRVRVLSAPTILASDNQEAHIEVGQEIPILTSQGVAAGAQIAGSTLFANTVQQRDTGVILSVMPRINPSGLVTLRLQQEVSAPLPAAAGTIQSPSIQKRSVTTQVTVQDGETISLGGIIATSQTVSKNRIPLLGDIPGLGLMFGSTSYSTTRTELIVLITPRVIRDADDAQQATKEFREKLRQLRKVIRSE